MPNRIRIKANDAGVNVPYLSDNIADAEKKVKEVWFNLNGTKKYVYRIPLLYVLDLTNNYLRAWEPDGTRRTEYDINIGTGTWRDVAVRRHRIYVLIGRELRAWDLLTGNRQSGDDIDLAVSSYPLEIRTEIWRGLSATDNYIYVLGQTLFYIRAWTFSGGRASSRDISIGSVATESIRLHAQSDDSHLTLRTVTLGTTDQIVASISRSGLSSTFGQLITLPDHLNWTGITASPDYIYALDNQNNYLRTWTNVAGYARDTGGDINLGTGDWGGVAYQSY